MIHGLSSIVPFSNSPASYADTAPGLDFFSGMGASSFQDILARQTACAESPRQDSSLSPQTAMPQENSGQVNSKDSSASLDGASGKSQDGGEVSGEKSLEEETVSALEKRKSEKKAEDAAQEKSHGETGKEKILRTGKSPGENPEGKPAGENESLNNVLFRQVNSGADAKDESQLSSSEDLKKLTGSKGTAKKAGSGTDLEIQGQGKGLTGTQTQGLEAQGGESLLALSQEPGGPGKRKAQETKGTLSRDGEKDEPRSVLAGDGKTTPQGKDALIELTLVDRRKEKTAGKAGAKKDFVANLSEKLGGQKSEGGPFGASADKVSQDGSFKLIEINPQGGLKSGEARSLTASNKSGTAAAFQQLLKEDGIPQIVKQSGIILKDNNQGEIRLILKPESLGKVRIQLNLNENNIVGRIIVENDNVRDAFSDSLNDLARAFEETGFSSARLDVAVEGRERDNSENKSGGVDPVIGRAAERLEENSVYAGAYGREDGLVNLLA